MTITAPQPDGYPCASPDFTVPLPGQITHWDPKRIVVCNPPIGFYADPWPNRLQPCPPHNTLPPQPVFDGTNAYPRVF